MILRYFGHDNNTSKKRHIGNIDQKIISEKVELDENVRCKKCE